MSSEMRELVKEMRAGTPCYVAKVGGGRCVNGAECLRCAERLDWADRLERALLARTEAGADGAIYQMMATDEDVDEDGNVRPDDPRMWMDHSREEYERLNNHPSVRSRIVYTHPQDASGDAERYRFLRENHSEKWEDAETHTQFSCSIDFAGQGHDIDAAIDAAMQAKEAK